MFFALKPINVLIKEEKKNNITVSKWGKVWKEKEDFIELKRKMNYKV